MHIYQRGKSWTYVIDLPNDPVTGKRRQKSKGGFRTKKEAQIEGTEVQSKVNKGAYAENSSRTYKEFLYIWLEDYARSRLKPNVFDNNKMIIEKKIIPVLGDIKLRELTPIRIQRYYNKLKDEGYSPDYIKSIHSVVSKTLRRAFKWDMLASDIMDKVDPPKSKKKQMEIWTLEECMDFLSKINNHNMFIVFSLAIWTGMRRGEILGLRWKDINFEKSTISVQQTITWTTSQGIIFQDTKTNNSNRSISIPSELFEDLKTRKKTINEKRLKHGPEYNNHDLVCCCEDGNPIKPRYLLNQYGKLIKKTGHKKIRFHDLRHTHATILIQLNIHPKVGAERLGQTPSMFMDRYAHVIESMQKEVANTIDQSVQMLKHPVDNL